MERPIFVFACGWRSGSTLVQRLLCSHPDIHIWGENRGLCDGLERLHGEIERLQPLSALASREFHAIGARAWIAMLNPPSEQFLEGISALMDRYFGNPVRAMGKSRWGFKEVRHGAGMVTFVQRLFPRARFLLLVRDPRACLASARATTVPEQTDGLLPEIGESAVFLEHWVRIAASFVEPLDPHVAMTVRYEDIVAAPAPFVERLGRFLDVPADGFSPRVFAVGRRGWLEEPPRLTAHDLECLAAAPIWQVAQRFGYTRVESV
jgi:hypothetical protein